jgi:L-fuconolactonase
MIKIDSHQHFWHYNLAEHTWMTDQMSMLKKDFLPEDLAPLLAQIQFEGCISVQARQSVTETNWLLQLAEKYDFIKGVVGWVDLCSPDMEETLHSYAEEKKLVGVRHVVHDEADDQFMLMPSFQHGIAALKECHLCYDLLIFPKHIPVAIKLVEQFPEQPFVVDHLAKPFIIRDEISPWKEDLTELAKHPNVYCKLSGMVTEARWNKWNKDDFTKYLDIITELFGTNRVMIGSDWPVCTLSGHYEATMNIVINYASQFPKDIQDGILGGNCINFYKIDRFINL